MLLYGDYDVDGTSAIVILKKGIDLLVDSPRSTFHIAFETATG